MPRYTEARIHALCKEVVAVESEEDVEKVLAELKDALREHMARARESLGAQAAAIVSVEHGGSKPQS